MSRKKIFKKKEDGIRFSLGTLVLMLFCTFILIVSTFVSLEVYYPVIPSAQEGYSINNFFKLFTIIPQIPAVIFIGALLGRKLAITSVIFYILIGLFLFPVFALGGGWRYIFNYGFGYILAYIPAVWLLGMMLKDGFNIKNIALGVLYSVLAIHILGILYMITGAVIKDEGWLFIKGWIIHQSGWKIVFDYILSFTLVYGTKLLRPFIWCYKKPY